VLHLTIRVKLHVLEELGDEAREAERDEEGQVALVRKLSDRAPISPKAAG
jgi:hypothetical protein